ncbi:MAG: D-glycero-beta-D-manno-heptose 1,7-bisphosphate 7-phosphatase [Clostridia bacterium]|nr:D-glycero-beta-D-manno-heptose 1,7-bisphosphate 7-phosphatase [Clostridia bacterium]
MKAVIMAGGRGTRIASVNSEVPKPMIPVLDKPILEYQIECLTRQGVKDIILVIGYLGHIVKDYFGDGKKFGANITYIEEKDPLGTAGALYFLKDEIKEDFLLLCGDLIFDIDVNRFLSAHKNNGATVTLFTHPNSHPYDSGIIIADGNGQVKDWLHKEDKRLWYRNRVNAGLHMLSPKIFTKFPTLEKRDLDRDILKPLISEGGLYVYDSPEYVKDMGTPDRYYSVIEDIQSGKVRGKNLANKQKAIFLDRDGTLNEYVGFLTSIDNFKLLDGVTEAVKKINESGYLAIVVSNQPVIARGEISLEELQEVHNKMETLLGADGAYLDAIYYCPHHPHKGYEGERPEYKIDCACRKPKPGMIFKAEKDFNIDLSQSWMVGDRETDVECGKNAGCKTALIGQGDSADINGKNLKDCIDAILR